MEMEIPKHAITKEGMCDKAAPFSEMFTAIPDDFCLPVDRLIGPYDIYHLIWSLLGLCFQPEMQGIN